MKLGVWKFYLLVLTAVATACAGPIELKDKAKSQVGDELDDIDGEFDHPFDDGDDKELNCSDNDWIDQSFDLDPDSVSGANVVFLLDDSGSMTGEGVAVAQRLSNFIDGIQSATGNNYRMLLVFNEDGSPHYGSAFHGDNPFEDYIYDPISNPNSKVYHFKEVTGSEWADIGFFRVFAPINPPYVQTLPSMIPTDISGVLHTDCAAGSYFRPRTSLSANTIACISNGGGGYNFHGESLSNYLLEDINVNFVSITDDNLNVNRGTSEYPQITDLMIKDLIKPLGASVSYKFHSIVGTVSNAEWQAAHGAGFEPIARVGTAHMGLSEQTNGTIIDIREPNWDGTLAQLQEQVIFSEQDANLQCKPSANVEVRFNDVLLDAEHYTIEPANKRIEFHPSAFEAFVGVETIKVKVSYIPDGE